MRFFETLAISAAREDAPWNIILSSQTVSTMTMDPDLAFLEIVVDDNNSDDIQKYLEKGLQRLRVTTPEQQFKWDELEDKISEKSDGVFLWARLVLDRLCELWDQGHTFKSLLSELENVPARLEDLFGRVLVKADGKKSLRFFQWAVSSARPLTLSEWSDVLAFVNDPSPEAVFRWRDSADYVDYDCDVEETMNNDEVLRKRIRNLSCGLVEVRHYDHEEVVPVAQDQLGSWTNNPATAGSFQMALTVEFVHHTAKKYFVSGKGFSAIKSVETELDHLYTGLDHLFILDCSITFAGSPAMKPLIEARAKYHDSKPKKTTDEPYNTGGAYSRPGGSPSDTGSVQSFVSFAASAASSLGSIGPRRPIRRVNLQKRRSRKQPIQPVPPAEGRLSSLSDGKVVESLEERVKGYLELLPVDTEGFQNTENFPRSVQEPSLYQDELSRESIWFDEPRRDSQDDHPKTPDIKTPARGDQTYRTPGTTDKLQKHPVLALYMVETFEFHAKAAEKEGLDPSPLLQRLMRPDAPNWQTWCFMQKAASPVPLLDFAVSQNLRSWVDCMWALDSNLDKCSGDTILIAAENGHDEILDLLLRHAASIRSRDYHGMNVLHRACLRPSPTALETILRCFNFGSRIPGSELMDHLKSTASWLATDLDLMGQTPLHTLARNPTVSSALMISYLDCFASTEGPICNINHRSVSNDTPLSLACYQITAKVEVCRALLDRGADRMALYDRYPSRDVLPRWRVRFNDELYRLLS